MIKMPAIYFTSPENPRNAIEIKANVIRVMEGPLKGTGTSDMSNRVLMAVNRASMKAKPTAVPKPKTKEKNK